MNSDQPLNIPVFEVGEVAELLQKFVDTAERSVEATADELIKVRVGGSFNVLSIEILDRSIDRDLRQKLEMAILSAVNSGLQKAALKVGQAFVDLQTRKESSTKP